MPLTFTSDDFTDTKPDSKLTFTADDFSPKPADKLPPNTPPRISSADVKPDANLVSVNPSARGLTGEQIGKKALEGLKEAQTTSFLDEALPTAEVDKKDSIPTAVGKEAYNLITAIPKFATSGEGFEVMPAAAAAPAVVAAGFTVDMVKNLGEKILDTYKNWGKMSGGQKAAAITEMAGTGALAGLLGHAAKKGVAEEPQIWDSPKTKAIKELFQQTKTAPIAGADPNLAPTVSAAAALNQSGDGQTIQPVIPAKPDFNTAQGVRVKQKPIVPETPPEEGKDVHVLDEIKTRGLKTKKQIQSVFPHLSNEEAAALRNQVWGKPVDAEVPKGAVVTPTGEVAPMSTKEGEKIEPPTTPKGIDSWTEHPPQQEGGKTYFSADVKGVGTYKVVFNSVKKKWVATDGMNNVLSESDYPQGAMNAADKHASQSTPPQPPIQPALPPVAPAEPKPATAGAAGESKPSPWKADDQIEVQANKNKNAKWQKARVRSVNSDGSVQVVIGKGKDATYATVEHAQTRPTKLAETLAAKKSEFEGMTPEREKQVKSDAKEFRDLVQTHGPVLGWVPGEAFQKSDMMEHGFQNASLKLQGLKNAMKAAGHEGDAELQADQAAALPKLKKFIEQKTNHGFQDSIQSEEGNEKRDVTYPDLPIGTKFKYKGEDFEVLSYDKATGTVKVKDGRVFGVKDIQYDQPIHVDAGSVKPPAEAEIPKLREGEKGTGELLQGEDAPFNLSGEKASDGERIAAEKAKAEADKAEAARIEKEKQPNLIPQGPGAKTSRAANQPESPETYEETSLKNAVADMERVTMGLPEATPSEARNMGKAWIKAGEIAKKDPTAPERIASEIISNPERGITDDESALLLRRKVDLGNAINDSAEKTWTEKTPELKKAAQENFHRLTNEYNALLDAIKKRGSEWGREGKWRQALAKEDYSFATQERLYRMSKGGKQLTPEEIQEVHQNIERLKRKDEEISRLRAEIERSGKKVSENEAKRVIDEAIKQPGYSPLVLKEAERIVAAWERRAAQNKSADVFRSWSESVIPQGPGARTKPSASKIPPAVFEICGIKIARGLTERADFDKQILSEYGQHLQPHLDELWEGANDWLNKNLNELDRQIGKQRAAGVKKSIKEGSPVTQQARVSAKIGEKMKAGDPRSVTPLVQKLARTLIASGIKTRDELIDEIHSILHGLDDRITREDTMDAISGYGDFRQLSKDEVSVKLRDWKRQMQMLRQLQDMSEGNPPLKTGMERAEWSKEQERLQKLVNDAKFNFQVPSTDPATQLQSALDTAKKRLQSQIDEYQRKINEGDFSKKTRREFTPENKAKLFKLEVERNKIKNEFNARRLVAERSNRNLFRKIADGTANLNRVNILSHISVIEHLAGAALENFATRPIGTGIAQLMRFSKTMDAIRKKAIYEGHWGGEKSAWIGNKELRTTGALRSYAALWSKLKTGKSDIDWINDSRKYPKEFAEIVQNVHGAIKEPVRQGIYSRSMELRTKAAEELGLDPQSDEVLAKAISSEAYNDANMDIFMGDNFLTKALHNNVNAYLRGHKGDPGLAAFTADVLDILFPIVNVSTNIAIRKFRLAAGLPESAIRIGVAMSRGELANNAEKLSPRDAELITKSFKYGVFGLALGVYAWKHYKNFGGIYVPGQNAPRNPDVKSGDIKVGDKTISHHVLHGPVGGYMNLIADAHRLYDKEVKDNPDSPYSNMTEAAFFAMFAGAKDIPSFATMGRLTSPFKSSGQKAGELARNIFVPGAVQDIAAKTDKPKLSLSRFLFDEPSKRTGKTFIDEIELGVPGLREKVPASKK